MSYIKPSEYDLDGFLIRGYFFSLFLFGTWFIKDFYITFAHALNEKPLINSEFISLLMVR